MEQRFVATGLLRITRIDNRSRRTGRGAGRTVLSRQLGSRAGRALQYAPMVWNPCHRAAALLSRSYANAICGWSWRQIQPGCV